MQTKWCSAIKRPESTQVSHVTLMACLRFIHQSFSLSVCLCAVWLCGAAGWTAAPRPGRPRSGGARGYATEPGADRPARHRLHPVYGLRHLAPGHLQWREGNWNGLIPHHRQRWAPWAWPAAQTCNSNPYNPYNTSRQHSSVNSPGWGGVSQSLADLNSQRKCRLIKVKMNIIKSGHQCYPAMPLSGALRDLNILISLSVFRANQGSSFWDPFAYNSKYKCTLLRVPFLIMICSNFHLLWKISKSVRRFSPDTPVSGTRPSLYGGDFRFVRSSLFSLKQLW